MPFKFAGYPAPFIRSAPGGGKKQQLLWGDFVNLLGGRNGEWLEVRGRGETGWMHEDDLQDERLLEINFVDVGQGDGAFVVTPNDRFLLVDAGERDNMFRFLRWRFNLRNHPERTIRFEHAVISHPDADHYRGFDPLFNSPQFQFGTVLHNGLVERVDDDDVLGEWVEHKGERYYVDLVADRSRLDEILNDPARVGRKWYPNLLLDCSRSGRTGDIRMLCASDGFLPGYEGDRELSVQVLGPVPDRIPDGNGGSRPALRWLGSHGETKNGHSVVLRARYRDVSILLGGDLNIPAEEHLLRHYTGTDPSTLPNGDDEASRQERERFVETARQTFRVDVAKACHHGSADFSHEFLDALQPLAFVISSGDAESHAHPRPDALGAFGKAGRGRRPLLFSTELARSANENIREPNELRRRIDELFTQRAAAETFEERDRVQKRIDEVLATLERSVAVYGMITLRTDGHNVILAQKLEKPRSGSGEEFDIHRIERTNGELAYVSKH